uniref:Uncharacterized protein n=1 Tax=Panagrolaimus sp. ES5 TaxID=591445 RepID=A0AC34GKI3_9BILA
HLNPTVVAISQQLRQSSLRSNGSNGSYEERQMPSTHSPQRAQSYHSQSTNSTQNAPTSISVGSPPRSPPTVIHHRSSSSSSKPAASMPPNTPANRSPNMNDFRSASSHVATYQQQHQQQPESQPQQQRQHYIRHQSRGSADSGGSGGAARKTNGYPQVPLHGSGGTSTTSIEIHNNASSSPSSSSIPRDRQERR